MRNLGWASAMWTSVLALAACGSNAPTPSTNPGTQGAPSSTTSASADPLDGKTWRSSFTCKDMVKALDRARLQKYETQVLSGLDCDGVMHITLAFADGELSITGQDGKTSPAIPYEIVNDRTFLGGFVQDTYRVQGDRLIFTGTKIIPALYPYDTKIMPGEHALNVASLMAAPFLRVS
jgi:hypothetical protein